MHARVCTHVHMSPAPFTTPSVPPKTGFLSAIRVWLCRAPFRGSPPAPCKHLARPAPSPHPQAPSSEARQGGGFQGTELTCVLGFPLLVGPAPRARPLPRHGAHSEPPAVRRGVGGPMPASLTNQARPALGTGPGGPGLRPLRTAWTGRDSQVPGGGWGGCPEGPSSWSSPSHYRQPQWC